MNQPDTPKLRVLVTAGDEPIVVNRFIEEVIKNNSQRIVGLAVVGSTPLAPSVVRKGRKNKSQGNFLINGAKKILSFISNIFVVLLIFGIFETAKQALRMFRFRLSNFLNRYWPRIPSRSIFDVGQKLGVHTWRASHVNDPKFLEEIAALKPDVIVNQAPGILREDFLALPRIGVLSRHNALLPLNRGRFSTFWSIYKGEEVTGVSIHFVEKTLDSGPIVLQKHLDIRPRETVQSLANRCYEIAPIAMTEALDVLESNSKDFIPNPDEESTYNYNPHLSQALKYRWSRIRGVFK